MKHVHLTVKMAEKLGFVHVCQWHTSFLVLEHTQASFRNGCRELRV